MVFTAIPPTRGYSQQSATEPTPASQTENQDTPPLAFEVVSIRPSKGDGWLYKFTDDGFAGTAVPLYFFVRTAFYPLSTFQIAGMPDWAKATYDIGAKVSDADVPAYQKLTQPQRCLMLQQILVDRFKLKFHREKQQSPVYLLVVARSGLRLKPVPTPIETTSVYGIKGYNSNDGSTLPDHNGSVHLVAHPYSMAELAHRLSWQRELQDKMAIDQTSLPGYYNFDLSWLPEQDATGQPTAAEPATGPSLFTALKEQLGLELKPSKALVDTIKIDHLEPPTPN
jgi:uncharacterized protein (TIGR03435 family)